MFIVRSFFERGAKGAFKSFNNFFHILCVYEMNSSERTSNNSNIKK